MSQSSAFSGLQMWMKAPKTGIKCMLPLPVVTTEELYNARSKMNKATGLAPGSWGAYERNEFSDSRDLHLPIHRMLNSLTWYWSLMFSLPAPFVALVYSPTSSLALLGAVFSELLRCLLSPRLRVLNIPTK